MAYPSEEVIGATYKGFNDKYASWGSNRVMNQQCGQTWLQTFAELNDLYSSGKQLTDLQLVTWNDYEEATEIESGIDNCLTLSPSLSGNTLQWNISGNENTVDHYTVYISSDGQNLMSLSDLQPGNRSLNLCSFPIPNDSYKLFVQAVGKPVLANQITGAINYTSTCAVTTKVTPPPAPAPTPTPTPAPVTVSFGASPSAITIFAGASGKLTVSAKPQSGTFNSPITLTCAGLPKSLNCSFSPATITPGPGVASSTLTITSVGSRVTVPPGRNPVPISAGFLLPFGIGGFALVGSIPRRRKAQLLALIVVAGLGMIGSSCGGNMTPIAQTAAAASTASSYAVTVQGKTSSNQLSTVVTVSVR